MQKQKKSDTDQKKIDRLTERIEVPKNFSLPSNNHKNVQLANSKRT